MSVFLGDGGGGGLGIRDRVFIGVDMVDIWKIYQHI